MLMALSRRRTGIETLLMLTQQAGEALDSQTGMRDDNPSTAKQALMIQHRLDS